MKFNSKMMFGAAVLAMTGMIGVSCSNTEISEALPTPPQQGSLALTVSTEFSPETRTTLNPETLIKWNSADKTKLGLMAYSDALFGGYHSYSSSTIEMNEAETGAKFTFSEGSYPIVTGEEAPVRVYYPVMKSGVEVCIRVTLSIEPTQTQAAAGESINGSECVPMIGDQFTLTETDLSTDEETKTEPKASKLHVLSSILAFYVYDSNGSDEQVKKITFQSDDNIAGNTEFMYLYENNDIPKLEGSVATASTSLTSAFALSGVTKKDDSAPIYLSIVPGSHSGQFVVETDKAYYVFPLDEAKEFARGEVKDVLLNLSNEKVEKTLKSALQTPAATITNLTRAGSGSSFNATIKFKRSNTSTVGVYVSMRFHTYNVLLPTSTILSENNIYYFGDKESSVFTYIDDNTASYKRTLGSPSNNETISYGIIPFDMFGNTGKAFGGSGYGTSTGSKDNPANEY